MLMQISAWTPIFHFLLDDILALGKSKWRLVSKVLTLDLTFCMRLLTSMYSFAWAEMRTVAANILSRFDVEEVSGQQVEFKQHVTMVFATGHWRVKLRPRDVRV